MSRVRAWRMNKISTSTILIACSMGFHSLHFEKLASPVKKLHKILAFVLLQHRKKSIFEIHFLKI